MSGRQGAISFPSSGFYSSVPGDPLQFHNRVLDQAMAKIQYTLPADLSKDKRISTKSLRLVKPTPNPKAVQNKPEPDRKRHCHGRHCKVPVCHGRKCNFPVFNREVTTGFATDWGISQNLYLLIQEDCGRIAAELSQKESAASALQVRQNSLCASNPVGSDCASATKAMNKLNGKISQLHDRYDQCVLHELRDKAVIDVSATQD